MPHHTRRALVVLALLGALYLFGLSTAGLVGPDEPRYASIGREMARSGDWITPRLNGEPWFEKPPLLYWLTAIATKLGGGPEVSPRLPVALMGWGFLIFFYFFLAREFGPTEALYATAVLGGSAGWLAYSFVGVTDVPMAATFCAALLLSISVARESLRGPWILIAIGALLGLATLAKGLVPLVLFAPMLWQLRKRIRAVLVIAGAGFVIAAPWYALCTIHNGTGFLVDLIWKHHFERFTSDVLLHVQPWWFYVPVLLGGLFPWTPLVALLRPRVLRDDRLKMLALWLLFAFVFFAAARNKLPGYMAPLLPPLCVVLGVSLAWARHTRIPLFLSAVLVAFTPVIVKILPQALVAGLSRSRFQLDSWLWTIPFVVLAGACLYLQIRGWRTEALLLTAGSILVASFYLKAQSLPIIDESASVRPFYRQHSAGLDGLCLQDVHRDAEYGLEYYASRPFPRCAKDNIGPKIMGVGKAMILLD